MLILYPQISSEVLASVFGLIMVLFGGVKLVGYFSMDLFRLAFQYDLSFGILMIALGIVVLFRPEKALSFICVVLGIICFVRRSVQGADCS